MSIRMTGMVSGLDTESIIQQLVSAKQTKVDEQTKAQTKLEWKQDAWKELNTKIKNLQTKYLSTMRFTDAYSKKTTKVSNSSAVSVITGEDAMNGVQTLQITKLAKSGYLTGGKVESADGSDVTALSKLSDLNGGAGVSGSFTVTTADQKVDINVTGDTTISDVLTQLKNAGLNANFDAKQQRFFISSKESGAANDFSITASDSGGSAALSALGIQTDISQDTAAKAQYQQYANYYVAGDEAATLANMDSLISSELTTKTDSYLEQYKSLMSSKSSAQSKIDEINEKYKDTGLDSVDNYQTQIDAKQELITAKKEEIESITDEDAKAAAQAELTAMEEEVTALTEKQTDAKTLETQTKNIAGYDEKINSVLENIDVTDNGDGTYSAQATAKLTDEISDKYYAKAEYAAGVMDGSISLSSGATKVSGQDAEIVLNGAVFTNTSNTFEINGLTFTALAETGANETITVTTEQDTDGIYDMIKNFLTEYNTLVNEMDKLYNADSASGYEPLTDDEKEAMSDSEIEKYETKIKDALLRNDSNLSTVNSALQNVMASGITVNGKTMYLSDFGIATLGYFESSDNEKHAYHIDGDEDDSYTSGNADKLKSMIASDPDTVISFFSTLSKNMYSKMSDLSKSVSGYRSYGSFYDDKKMESDYSDYTTKISELEEKLNDYEDKWYSKFSAMETALAKLQSNSSAVTSLLGG